MGWRDEFAGRGVDFDVPESIIRLEGLEDLSWHNDACPSFGTLITESLVLRIWCEAPDYDDRESGADHQFTIGASAWDDQAWTILRDAGLEHATGECPAPAGTPVVELETDDPNVAVSIFITVLAHLQTARRSVA